MRRRLSWKGLVGLAVTLFFLWWVFRGEDLGAVARAVARGHPGWLLAAVAVATAGFLFRAMRWQVLLTRIRSDTSLRSRFAAVNIGFATNNLLPARIGEFARAYALSRLEPISMSASFASLVVERFLDAVALLTLLLVVLLLPGFPESPTVQGQDLGVAVAGLLWLLAGGLFFLVLLLVWPERVVRVAERIAVHLPEGMARRGVDALEAFLEGLEVLRSPGLLLWAMLWSWGIWLWYAFSFWLGFRAYGIEAGFRAAIFVQVAVATFVFLPSSPGFFGVFQAGVKMGLTEVYGVASTLTLAFAFGYHIAAFVPVTLIGLYYVWRLGFSLEEMRRSEDRVESAVEARHPEARRVLSRRKKEGT